MIFIGIKESLDNAFYMYTKRTNQRTIPVKKIKAYVESVVRTLEENDEQVILLINDTRIKEFFSMYTDIYELKRTEKGEVVSLRENVSIDELNDMYINYPIKSLIEAFRKEKNVRKLF